MGQGTSGAVGRGAWRRTAVPVLTVGVSLALPMCSSDAGPVTSSNAGASGAAGAHASAGSSAGGAAGRAGSGNENAGTSGAGVSGGNAGAGESDAGAGGSPDASSCATLPTCGGDPTGHWAAAAEGGASSGLAGACVRPSTPPLPPSDCSGIVFGPAGSANPSIEQISLPVPTDYVVSSADLSLEANHNYAFSMYMSGNSARHFAASCLAGDGSNPTCALLKTQIEVAYRTEPGFGSLDCPDAPGGGCDCSWTQVVYTEDRGTWQVAGSTLTFESSLNLGGVPPTPIAYDVCELADTLSLSLHPGASSISGAVGLHTVLLHRAP